MPQFKGIKEIKVAKAGLTEVNITGNALVFNPNFFSAKVLDLQTEIIENDKTLAVFSEKKPFRIKSLRETSIPLQFSFSPAKLSLSTAAALMTGNVDFQYKVRVKVRYFFRVRQFEKVFNSKDFK
jgi:LEA14-like dessication related protein